MAYRVIAPEASVLRDLSEFKDADGKVIGYDRESVVRLQGDVIADADVAQVVKDAYENGDPHINGLLEYVEGEPDEIVDAEHDVNQDLNLSDPEAPVEEAEFETVQHPEDGPQQHKPSEKADAVKETKPKKPRAKKKAAAKDE